MLHILINILMHLHSGEVLKPGRVTEINAGGGVADLRYLQQMVNERRG